MSFRPAVRCVLAALVTAFAPTIATSQERPDVVEMGNGAHGTALGGAITAVASDVQSIGWNPAGLTYITRPEFAYTGRLIFSGTDAKAKDLKPNSYPIWVARGEYTATADLFEFIGFAYPFKIGNRTVTGAVAYRQFTDGVRVGRFESGTRVSNGRYVGSTDISTGPGVRAISPSIGIEVTPRIRVGATANLLMGAQEHRLRGPYPYKYSASETDYSGLALQAGVLVQATEKVRVGVRATLPHERSFKFDNDTTVRSVTRAAPLALSVGTAVRVTEERTVSVDFRYSPWSGTAYTEDDTGDPVASFYGLNNAYSFHTGYERSFLDEDANRIIRRAGFFWRRTTVADYLAGTIDVRGVSVGKRWIYTRAQVDASLMYARSDRWTRHRDSERSISLRNHDITLGLSVRRLY